MSSRRDRNGTSDAGTPQGRERGLRAVDETVTERIERFLADRADRDASFTSAELAVAVDVPRFGERDAHLFLVDLVGQGRVRRDRMGGWRACPADPR